MALRLEEKLIITLRYVHLLIIFKKEKFRKKKYKLNHISGFIS